RDDNFGGLNASLSLLCKLLADDGKSESAAEVIAFAHDVRREIGLKTVVSELDLMEQVESTVGSRPHGLELTLTACRSLFERIR
ncbi:hypothetical protein ABTM58_19905, partial [Acinetobacter baumannii]